MKRGLNALLVLLVLFGIFSFVFVHASIDSSVNNLAKSVDSSIKETGNNIQTTQDFLTKEEVRNQYLKTEWTKLLETKPVFKQIIEGYRQVSPYSDPIINFLVGMTPEFSLLFILVFVIWFTLVKYYYTVYEALRDLELFSKSTNVIIYGLVFFVLILVQFFQGLSVFLANKIVALIELILNPWIQIILWIVAALVFIGLSKISKKVVAFLRLYRLKSARRKGRRDEIEAREKLIRAAEAAGGSEASSSASMRRAREREEMKEVDYERSTSDEL